MHVENYVMEALDRALAWEIPDDALGRVVEEQVALLASAYSD